MAKIETNLADAQIKIAEALFALKPVVTIGKRAGNPISTEIPLGDFPEAAWLKIMTYGAQRTFNDSVGGADIDQETKVANVREMIENFKQGIVGRVAAEGVDPVTAGVRTIMRAKVKKAVDEKTWAKFEALDAKDQNAKLDEQFAKQTDAFRAKVTDTVKTKLAAKQAEKQAMASLSVDLDL